ncbi:MAG: 23S rRNA pseudouridine(1911/1915/1917) synthase RluD [Gammaproteobacteria bacterium]|nr:23S rRNA pseudouridine(1911/1915/1917) synthase RluD [Gammaproteobacteria bacterium]
MSEQQFHTHELSIPDELAGSRLDQALAELLPEYSRSRLQSWIKAGSVQVDGRILRPRDKVLGGEQLSIRAPREAEVPMQPENIALNVVYQDEHLLVIDKPAGLVVHPGAGNPASTLQNALLHLRPGLVELPRAGIIHRLDKDTTGLMVVTASIEAHTVLTRTLAAREILREYQAIACGVMTAGGDISAPIGRASGDRRKMAVRDDGRPAVTQYRVLERFRAHTHIRLKLETGRTHQIRVHMAHLHFPLVGDPVYGGRLRIPAKASEPLIQSLRGFHRQALHAARLGFAHPVTAEPMEWTSPLPRDMATMLDVMREDARGLEV